MKKQILPFLVLAASAMLVAACSKSSESGAAAPAAAKAASTRPAPDPNLPELKVTITGNDQMKFNITAISAKPGQKITLTLKNVGTMPKMSMGHNFVLLPNELAPLKFLEASQTHMGNDYVAPELEDKIIAHTKLLGPGESDTITFAAPRTPGAYDYLCSFPGHYSIGMKGVLTVE